MYVEYVHLTVGLTYSMWITWIVEGLVILRRVTRCVTALSPKKFSMKEYFSPYFRTHTRAQSFFVSSSLDTVTRNLYLLKKKNRYSLVDEATPLEIGTKKQHSITLFKYKTISSFITIIITFSLSSLSNLNFPWRTTCALINFFITTPVPCFSLLGFLLKQKKNKKKKTRSGGNSGLGDYL